MTTTASDELPKSRVRSRLELAWRWALIAGWVAVLAVAVGTGEREGSWSDLRHAVSSGDVHEVSTTPGLPPHARGSGPVEVSWRDGIIRYRTTVRESRPVRRWTHPRAVPDVDAALTQLQPGLTIDHHEWGHATSTVLGWRVSGWLMAVSVALGVATLLLLITQPEPWRATRWAWFWLLGAATPLGLAAYLLLSGPTGLLPPPRDPRRRLTGGWAFLLAFALSSLSNALVLALT
ncbi:hypothetical protein [Nocardioides sp. URHA0032]|uniref:hypothetical protein n=1 Tax=Nocardioides sp. URHA0032 TaxID=1380388 RepID=UPI00048BEB89|nr:hypothetical protein [Nocardioides sp. URHA0032]